MDAIMKILPTVIKGIGYAASLAAAAQNAAPAYRAIRGLLKKAENGTVTDADIAQTESDLDSLIERFNRPI